MGFVFAMIWGVVVGTYSSVFVASNILLLLGVNAIGQNQMRGWYFRAAAMIPNIFVEIFELNGLLYVASTALIAGVVRGFSGFGTAIYFCRWLANILILLRL